MLNQTVFARLANLLAALALVLLLAGPFGPGQGTDGDCVVRWIHCSCHLPKS